MKKITSALIAIIIILSSFSAFSPIASADGSIPLVFSTYEHLPITAGKPYGFVSIKQGTLSAVDRADGDLALKLENNFEIDFVQNPEDKGGKWELSFEFKTNNAAATQLGFRMTKDIKVGGGVAIGNYDSEYYIATPTAGKSPGGKENGKIGNLYYKVGDGDDAWNTYQFIIDYVNDTYTEYLNGEKACSGKIGKTAESFQRIRFLGQFSAEGGYLDNITLKKESPDISISDIKYKMVNAGEVSGERDTVNGTNLETLTFSLHDRAVVTKENAKILNADKEVVSTDVISNGNDVIFSGFTASSLPNGYYKFVLESDATVGGVPVGNKFEKNFVVSNLFYSKNIIKPKENAAHPLVFLSDEFISGIYDESGNIKEQYKTSYQQQKRMANSSLPTPSSPAAMNSSISQRLMARALMYALGEVDYSHARKTIEFTLKYLENPYTASTYSIDMYKDLGTNGIQVGSLVYDWCYDAFESDAERELLAKRTLAIYEIKQDTNGDGTIEYVQPCRPDNISSWGALAGKAVGMPIIYNSICAIAFSDIYEDIRDELPQNYPENLYNSMMGKIQGDMAAVVRMYGTSGALSDGSIAYSRDYYTYYVYVMLKRLGATDAELYALYGNQEPIGYKMLYSRLPYGANIKQGDDYSYSKLKLSSYINRSETTDMGLLANIYGNEYFNFQYLKENYNETAILSFLTMFGTTEQKFPDDLPLAYKTSAPRTEIMARTSWQDGITSKTVSAYMNMNERRSGDHDHSNIGNFQLYYKGPLTMPNGIYNGTDWGSSYFFSYATRSVSSNCVTVYMPGEKYHPKYNYANDGGQKISINKSGSTVMGNFSEHFSNANIWAVTEGAFIGPNTQTPAFSYLKGDITNAYNAEKMESYKRAMVFMDTFSDTYPGVMIVFDRVVSKDASYKKKWLLQAVVDPEVNLSEGKITIKNQTYGANGKLVNKTLLPENAEFTKVGGIDNYTVDGKNYTAPNVDRIDIHRSGYRVEVSPKSENTEDIFLNAMFVSDADTTAPDIEMIKEETAEFVGVTALDRTVLFSKNGENVKEGFSFTVRNNNGGGKMLCLITDVAPGKWQISGNENIICLSKKDENCITVSLTPGNYTFTPAGDSAAITSVTWPEATKEKFGDFVIKLDSSYMYMPDETYIKDDVLYISAKTAEQTGENISTEQTGSSLTINRDGNISKINAGDNFYTYNGTKINIDTPAVIMDEKIYLPVFEMGTALAITSEYLPAVKVLIISSGSNIANDNLLSPTSVYAPGIEKIELLYDKVIGDALEFPNAAGKQFLHTPIVYTLGESICEIEKIELCGSGIISGSKSTLDILVSADGDNFYSFPYDFTTSDQTVTFTPQHSIFAKYVKFIPNSSAKLREAAVYGIAPNNNCFFINKKESLIGKNSPFETQIYIDSNFTSASLYFEDEKVCDITNGGIQNITIPAEIISKYNNEKCSITLSCICDGVSCFDTMEVTPLSSAESLQIVNINFNGNSFHNSAAGGTVTPGTNMQGHALASFTDGKYKITLPEGAAGAAPYILFNKLKKYVPSLNQYASLNQGIYTVKFTLETSSENISFSLESRTRDVNNPELSSNTNYIYPASGPTNHLIFKKAGKLDVTLVLDTVNCIGKLYTADEGENKKLLKEFYYSSNGLGQVRLLATKVGTAEEFITLDNFTIDYREMSTQNIVFVKDGNNTLFANINTADFKGESLKVVKAVKLCGKLVSLDIEDISSSALFDIPEDFYKTKGYTAEIYVYSGGDILNPLDYAKYTSQ